jgi:DNA-binding transcriptional LysR family regulator
MPTPYAQQLAPPIQRACELVENLGDIDTDFDPRSATHTFRFYMTDIGEAIFLPRLLSALDERAPQVKVKVLPIPEYGEQAAMAAGEVDLAVGFFPDLKSGFFQQRLYQDAFVCLIRADHPLARRRSRAPSRGTSCRWRCTSRTSWPCRRSSARPTTSSRCRCASHARSKAFPASVPSSRR